jgi:DNA-binding NtrC family response regulator
MVRRGQEKNQLHARSTIPASLSETLRQAQLRSHTYRSALKASFGHEKGAFYWCDCSTYGPLRAGARGNTVLDEVVKYPELQPKLLRFYKSKSLNAWAVRAPLSMCGSLRNESRFGSDDQSKAIS